MKRLFYFAAAALSAAALAACSPSTDNVKSAAPPPTSKAKIGDWGYDASIGDKSVKPGDDFFRYALGGWLKTAQVPPDRTFTGIDLALTQQAESDVKQIITDAAASTPPDGSNAQKIGDFYAAFLDESGIEKKGVAPIKPALDAIDAAADKDTLGPIFGQMLRAGATTPFFGFVDIDAKDPTRYIFTITQSGLSFGERDYYLKPGAEFVKLRAVFQAHVERMLSLAGYADAKAQAAQVLALETKLAGVQWPPEKDRQRDLTTNIETRSQLDQLAAGAPLAGILKEAGLDAQPDFIVQEPDVLTKAAAIFKAVPLDHWKAYLRYQTLTHFAAALPKTFDEETFSFYSKALHGAQAQKDRWRRAVDYENAAMGEAVGQLYVAKYFPSQSRASAQNLVDNLRASLKAKIGAAKWMSESTRQEALTKLSTFLPKIGYPDKWKSYETLKITRGDLVGDMKSADEWAWNDGFRKLGQPIDKGEWLMTPQEVNAYYRPETNEVTFPAAILQAPYFDPAADAAANYGAIGAVIGHEMSHGFDDQGRKSDSTGKLRDWWTKEDAARYDKEAGKIVAQFNAFEPVSGLHINGKHTLGENIADLAGLSIAYDAYKLSLGAGQAPVIDGLTGDQRFFLAYAQSWQTLYRPERLRDLVLTNEHSPAEYRVNGIVRNFDPWYAAFSVDKTNKLYLAPEKRARLW